MNLRKPDIGYIPTSPQIVESMLSLAKLTSQDILYDLGSGDGRILITAAQKYGTKGVGIDIDPQRIQQGQGNAQAAGIASLVEFRHQDLFAANFGEATVVIMYLLPHLNLRLRSQLWQQLQPGAKVISRDFKLGDWEPSQTISLETEQEEVTLYYWQIQ